MFKSLFAISDEQAMWRVQTEDDHATFALMVERWREKIRQLCIRMTGKVTATSYFGSGASATSINSWIQEKASGNRF